MRVLHVIETLGRGGAERLLVTALPALARQGVTPAVAVLRPPYDLQPELEAAGITVMRLNVPHKWRLGHMARQIAQAATTSEADLVQAHLYFPGLGVALMRLLRLQRAATVMTYHNLAYAGANQTGAKLRFRRGLAALLTRAGMDRGMAVSDAVADHFAKALRLRARPEVIPNPLDPVVHEIPQTPLGESVRRIVVPGRLVREKGHDDLLAALPRCALSEGVEIVFAGGGPREATLRAAAEALPHDIRLTGTLSHRALLTEVGQADLVVIPSRYEGFGIAALEALALGRPVLATTAGGLPEAIGEAGRLVPPGDPGALAEALSALVTDPAARRALAALGPAQAARFDAGAIAARYLVFYETLLAERPPK